MSRALVILYGQRERQKAHSWIEGAPPGTRVEFKRAQRTLAQNSLMWVLLTAIAEQVIWSDGKKYVAEDWKDYFMHALRKGRWMPSEDGGYVPIGMRSSDLSKDEMGDLIEIIQAFCAKHGVVTGEADGQESKDPARSA